MRKNLAFWSAALLLLVSGCTAPTYNNSSTRILMDTVVNISAEAELQVINEAMDQVERYDKLLSRTYSGSDVARLNASGSAEVSDDTLRLIKSAAVYSEKTGGCFDITVGSITPLWDFTNGVKANSGDIERELSNVGYKNISYEGRTVKLGGSKIDLGACAKGFVADKLHEYFTEKGINNALIDLGGNLYIMGGPRDIGIKNPFGEGTVATVRVYGGAVVTAGTYERSFTDDGGTYHHILDPKTGYPAKSDVVSVTVFSESALEADSLSTALVVMGLQRGLDFVESAEGVEAIFVTDEGEIFISSGIYCKDGIYRL